MLRQMVNILLKVNDLKRTSGVFYLRFNYRSTSFVNLKEHKNPKFWFQPKFGMTHIFLFSGELHFVFDLDIFFYIFESLFE